MQNTVGRTPPAYLVGSVDLALQIILLVQRRGEVRVRDVAQEFGVAASTAHRLLRTLIWREFLTQDRLGKAYRAGPVILELAATTIAGASVRTASRPHIEQLAQELEETVTVMVREGSNARFVDAVESRQLIRATARPGTVLPASTIAGGKVLLAWMKDEQRRALYPRKLPRLTSDSTMSYEALSMELVEVRARGYALNVNGSIAGLSAIGVPIRKAGGEVVASIAVSKPSARWTPSSPQDLLAPLLRCAAAIAAQTEAE